MRPVDAKFPISQLFAGLATRGVAGRPDGSEVEYLVWLYGDYQPYGHAGVDIACPVGTPIRAMRSGTIVYAGWGEDLPGDDSWGPAGYFRRWGMYKTFPGIVTVSKADGTNEYDIYGHQSDNNAVHIGMHVTEGQVIGKSGDTKTRTQKVGPHLHVVTVADPVNYSTNWPHLIFGCVDPTPLFGGSGLVLQGAITNAATTQAQEDELSAQFEADARGEFDGLRAFQTDVRGAIQEITDETEGLNAFIIDVRGDLANKGAQLSAQAAAIQSLTGLLADKQGLDVEAVRSAVASAIADGITLTVSAGGSGE